jgi:hypothetical protein
VFVKLFHSFEAQIQLKYLQSASQPHHSEPSFWPVEPWRRAAETSTAPGSEKVKRKSYRWIFLTSTKKIQLEVVNRV